MLGSIPSKKPVCFPSLLVNTFFFFTAIYSTKLKQQPVHALTAGLPLPLIVTSAWVRAYCNLRNEMERNEVKICSLRSENL